MSLCNVTDSDISLHSLTTRHRKLCESFYSGTESQQSMSDRSFYDNVDIELELANKCIERAKKTSTNFLLPPTLPHKVAQVNRSKSFQETAKNYKHLSSRYSNFVVRRKPLEGSNHIDDTIESISNHSSVSPESISSISDSNTNCNLAHKKDAKYSLIKPTNGPFYMRLLRRISLQWHRCKKVPRGEHYKIFQAHAVFFSLYLTFH